MTWTCNFFLFMLLLLVSTFAMTLLYCVSKCACVWECPRIHTCQDQWEEVSITLSLSEWAKKLTTSSPSVWENHSDTSGEGNTICCNPLYSVTSARVIWFSCIVYSIIFSSHLSHFFHSETLLTHNIAVYKRFLLMVWRMYRSYNIFHPITRS